MAGDVVVQGEPELGVLPERTFPARRPRPRLGRLPVVAVTDCRIPRTTEDAILEAAEAARRL